MTCRERMRNEVIDDMMVDAGLWNAPEVRTALGTLASLAALKPPRAGAELTAMLAGGAGPLPSPTTPEIATAPEIATTPMAPAAHAAAQPARSEQPEAKPARSEQPEAKPARSEQAKHARPEHFDELARRRWLRKNRPIVIGAVVLTAMGLGVSGVAAATAGLPGGQQNIIQRIITHWAPAWDPAPPAIRQPVPSPDSPGVSGVPSSGAAPSNAPAPTGPAAHGPGAGGSQGAQQGKGGQGSGSQPGQAPAGQSGQDGLGATPGKGGKLPVQGTADGAAAAGTAIKTATATASTAVKTASPLVLLDNTSLPSWLLSLTAR